MRKRLFANNKTPDGTFKAMSLKALLSTSFITLLLLSHSKAHAQSDDHPARDVISRVFGKAIADKVNFRMTGDSTSSYECHNGRLLVSGNSVVSLCHAFYAYVKATGQGMSTWDGTRNDIHLPWKTAPRTIIHSPYKYHYYMNVVTHGYSAAYWDFKRWQKELDWMALHGMDMLLVNGAFEAVLYRTFLKLGLSKGDALAYFTGPAHFPWNRMGNITGWDGPFPEGYLEKQLALAHQIQDRMKELKMTPIAPCFAGFVPETINKVFPEAKITKVYWGGFSKQYASNILLPDDPAFKRIGGLFLTEYEKEFGKGKFYLADNFNEMEVPRAPGETESALLTKLSNYGNAVYQSIKSVNPDAVWVMQGWTFPYNGDFWTYDRLNALVSRAPDDKLLILDLANEYNHDLWKIPPSWVTYKGFMNKMWIYSFIPNMGGKTVWNGILDTYANQPSLALHYAQRGNLVGYGFAPEGIENNDLIYELLSDVGYTDEKIDLDTYLKRYCVDRYGACPRNMEQAFDYFRKSCYGTFTDHPRFGFQTDYTESVKSSVNADSNFREGVRLFLSCRDSLGKSSLYTADAIELTAQYAGYYADRKLQKALASGDSSELTSSLDILRDIDRLLQSHPTQRLGRWVEWARSWGADAKEKNYYESNAKRLISNWGGGVGDYAARMWSGMIESYYAGRIKAYMEARQQHKKFDVNSWTATWIHTPFKDTVPAFANPLEKAAELLTIAETSN